MNKQASLDKPEGLASKTRRARFVANETTAGVWLLEYAQRKA